MFAFEQVATEIVDVILSYNVSQVYIGMPISDDGHESKVAPIVRKFTGILKEELSHSTLEHPELDDLKIEYADERYTTKLAHNQLHQMGRQPSKSRDIVDQLAAVNILESVISASA